MKNDGNRSRSECEEVQRIEKCHVVRFITSIQWKGTLLYSTYLMMKRKSRGRILRSMSKCDTWFDAVNWKRQRPSETFPFLMTRIRIQKPEVRIQKSESRSQEPESGIRKNIQELSYLTTRAQRNQKNSCHFLLRHRRCLWRKLRNDWSDLSEYTNYPLRILRVLCG